MQHSVTSTTRAGTINPWDKQTEDCFFSKNKIVPPSCFAKKTVLKNTPRSLKFLYTPTECGRYPKMPGSNTPKHTAQENQPGAEPAYAAMTLHRAGSEFIAKVEAGNITQGPGTAPQVVLIMDNSGSMGSWSTNLCQQAFPDLCQKIGMAYDDELVLILFAGSSSAHKLRVRDLKTFQLPGQGVTNMAGVFDLLIANLDPANSHAAVFVLSDGEIYDTNPTLKAASMAAVQLKGHYQLKVSAMRFFTSRSQPDTRALASVLQLNTDVSGQLIDFTPSSAFRNQAMEDVATELAKSYGNPTHAMQLECANPVIRVQPWDAPRLQAGIRVPITMWLSGEPGAVTINGSPVQVRHAQPVTADTAVAVLGDRLEFFLNQLKLLKVINNEESRAEITRIVTFFRGFESSLQPAGNLAPFLAKGDLKGRQDFLRRKAAQQLKSITSLLEQVANDDRVGALNMAQQADYLRKIDVSKNSKALARRAEAGGLDFDETLRHEVRKMRGHINELNGINDDHHQVSFYSRASTLEGIRSLCGMVDDKESFEGLSALDLLQVWAPPSLHNTTLLLSCPGHALGPDPH